MLKRVTLFVLMALLAVMPTFGASENSVDKTLSVKDDATFEPGGAYVSLFIQERHANEFGSGPVGFRVRLKNAEWFEDGDPATADPAAIQGDTAMIAGATIDILRIGDRDLEITVKRSGADLTEKAWWRIPIYGKVTDPGLVTLEIDGRDGYVSSGTYTLAQSHGGNYLNAGYRFTPSNAKWMTFREPTANAYAGTQVFRLVLENGTWFADADGSFGPQAMLKAAAASGVEGAVFDQIRRVDGKTLEITLSRGAESSVKAQAVWSLPLYFQVDEFGLAKVDVQRLSSAVAAGTLGSSKVTEPVRFVRRVTLTLNQPDIRMQQGAESRTVALDVSPVNPAGTTLIPVRGVFEQLGGAVLWDAQARQVTITVGGRRIVLNADSAAAMVDDQATMLAQSPVITNGRLLIPLRSVSEQLGFGVEWIEATQQIIIRQD